MSPPVKFGLFVPLTSKSTESAALHDFLLQGYDLVQDKHEPETVHWFAIKYSFPLGSPSTILTTQYLILDTFATESGRQAHLNGAVAAALMQKKDALLVEGNEGVSINPVEILASKVTKPAGASGIWQGLKYAVAALMNAKPDKVEKVKQYLRDVATFIQNENDPLVWIGFWFPGTEKFGMLSVFSSKTERAQHLSGPAATAMLSNTDGLFAGPSDVVNAEILAAKV